MNYFKLYFVYLKRSFITRLEYKKDTIISILSFIFGNASAILSIYFILNSIPSLKGWNMYQLGFLYGFSMMPVSLDHLFADDLWNVAYNKVKSGELDRMFLRPVPVLFQVIAETFQLEGLGELIVGIIMISLCGGHLGINWTFPIILLLIVATIFGALIITELKILTSSFAFIFKRSGPLVQMVYNCVSFTNYPLKIFPKVVQVILTFIIPFALFISLPIESILFDTYSPYMLSGIIILFALVFGAISLLVWKACISHYESSGS